MRAKTAAHGTNCFTVAVTLITGDGVIDSSIDDYIYQGVLIEYSKDLEHNEH